MAAVVSRRASRIAAVVAILSLAPAAFGCARAGYGILVRDDSDMPWGDYAASLDVPDCPSGNAVLTVNTAADELAGDFIGSTALLSSVQDAGPTLSLREALWIAANNSATAFTIRFDDAVFPVQRPARILLDGPYDFPANVAGACIDGRERGVVVEWPPPEALACCDYTDLTCRVTCVWGMSGSLQVGLTLLSAPTRYVVGYGTQVAGCRFNTDGGVSVRGENTATIEVQGDATGFGPGNVVGAVTGVSYALWVTLPSSAPAVVRDNYFGYDPTTREHFTVGHRAVGVNGPAAITDNVFVVDTVAIGDGGLPPGDATAIVVAGNWLGYLGGDADGAAPGQIVATATFVSSTDGRFTVGPDNVVTGAAAVANVGANGVRLTRNSLFRNAAVLVAGASPVAPLIGVATTTLVSGTCAVAGLVEVFSDAADQGEQFLGDAPCDGPALTWQLADPLSPRWRNLTATLTDAQGRTSTFSAPMAVP